LAAACLALAGSSGCRLGVGEAPRDPADFAWMVFEALPQQAQTSDGVLLWYDAAAAWRMRDERALRRFGRMPAAVAYVDDVYQEELCAVVTRKSTVELLGGETAPPTREVLAGREVAPPIASEIVEEVRSRVSARLDEVHLDFRELKIFATAVSTGDHPEKRSHAGSR
jgi:hypothetical protein